MKTKTIYTITLAGALLAGCGSVKNASMVGSKNVLSVNEHIPAPTSELIITKGVPVYNASNVLYKRNNKNVFNINFAQPVVVDVATKPYGWGYFQFPKIGRKIDGSIQVSWAMHDDSMEAYGSNSTGAAYSADGGKTWVKQEYMEVMPDVKLPNGDKLAISTPKPIDEKDLKLPKPLGTADENYRKAKFVYYKLQDLPEERRGVFFNRLKAGTKEWTLEHDALDDAQATRYVLAGKMPIVWWGDIRVAADGSVIAGVYPGNMVRSDGTLDPKCHVFFYRSTDQGRSWHIQGRIYYKADNNIDLKGDKRMGLLEPGFEILKDGTFLCVMRTTDGAGNGPMYASYSKDMGKTWTTPKVITTNGVLPRLLQLDNGVIVLASGRPGVQLRFANVKDKQWSEPFEMLPYEGEKEAVSCGYTELLATGKNSFIIAYSDFKYKTPEGEIRKAIKVREVTINPK